MKPLRKNHRSASGIARNVSEQHLDFSNMADVVGNYNVGVISGQALVAGPSLRTSVVWTSSSYRSSARCLDAISNTGISSFLEHLSVNDTLNLPSSCHMVPVYPCGGDRRICQVYFIGFLGPFSRYLRRQHLPAGLVNHFQLLMQTCASAFCVLSLSPTTFSLHVCDIFRLTSPHM